MESPFSNTLILGKVFDKLQNVQDLLKCRQVCKTWRKEIGHFFPKSVRVTINWEDNWVSSRRMDHDTNAPIPCLSSFMKYVDAISLVNVLFSTFTLLDWNMSTRIDISTKFWLTCGPLIKHLKFDGLWISPFDENQLTQILFEHTPNMKSVHLRLLFKIDTPIPNGMNHQEYYDLALRHTSLTSEQLQYQSPNTSLRRNFKMKTFCYAQPEFLVQLKWEQIFYSYPALEVLNVKLFSKDEQTLFLEAMIQVKKEHPECFNNLKTLHLFGKCKEFIVRQQRNESSLEQDEYVLKAAELDIPSLTCLYLCLHSEITLQAAATLLKNWRQQLRTLVLNPPPFLYLIQSPIPQFHPLIPLDGGLPNLDILRINCSMLPPTFEFLSSTPKLHVLDILTNDEEALDARAISTHAETFSHESLREIRTRGIVVDVRKSQRVDQSKWVQLFPNLNFLAENKTKIKMSCC